MPPKKRPRVDGNPWTFTAGLYMETYEEIRKIMDLLYSAFLPKRWPWDLPKRNPRYLPRDQRRAVKRMLEECVDNELLSNVTYWFASKYNADEKELWNARIIFEVHASHMARNRMTYQYFYDDLKDDWYDFIDEETKKGKVTRWYGNTIPIHISEVDDGEETEEEPELEPEPEPKPKPKPKPKPTTKLVKLKAKTYERPFQVFEAKTRSGNAFMPELEQPRKKQRLNPLPRTPKAQQQELEKPEEEIPPPLARDVTKLVPKIRLGANLTPLIRNQPRRNSIITTPPTMTLATRPIKKPTLRKANGALQIVTANIKKETQVLFYDESHGGEDDIPLAQNPMIKKLRESVKGGFVQLSEDETRWLEEYDSDGLPMDLWGLKKELKHKALAQNLFPSEDESVSKPARGLKRKNPAGEPFQSEEESDSSLSFVASSPSNPFTPQKSVQRNTTVPNSSSPLKNVKFAVRSSKPLIVEPAFQHSQPSNIEPAVRHSQPANIQPDLRLPSRPNRPMPSLQRPSVQPSHGLSARPNLQPGQGLPPRPPRSHYLPRHPYPRMPPFQPKRGGRKP